MLKPKIIYHVVNNFLNHHKKFWDKNNSLSLVVSFVLLGVALSLQGFVNDYLNSIRGTPVGDLLLSKLPLLDIDLFIIQASLAVTFMGIFFGLYKPKYLSIGFKSLALFIVIRSLMISLTHLGAYPHQIQIDSNNFGFWLYNIFYNTSNDYFFSAHTGVPFLMAFVFWPEKLWRYLFILSSLVLGTSMLIARIHYSIDVVAAPFIAYSIFALARKIFHKDYKLSREY